MIAAILGEVIVTVRLSATLMISHFILIFLFKVHHKDCLPDIVRVALRNCGQNVAKAWTNNHCYEFTANFITMGVFQTILFIPTLFVHWWPNCQERLITSEA